MKFAQRAVSAFAAAALLLGVSGKALAVPTIVPSGQPFRLDKVQQQPGGQSGTAIAPWDHGGGFIATWLNYRSATDRRAYVGFFSGSAVGQFPISQMGAATGPTSGVPSLSAAPVGLPGGTSLVLFSADKRGAPTAAKRDVFAQRMGSGPWTPVGLPLPVNTTLANLQDSIVATQLTNGNALVAFVSHATAAASFDIRGRVLNGSGAGVTLEKALTVNTAGGQTPTALAALPAGKSVLAYVVKTGTKQEIFVQRLDATATRVGTPTLLKTTTGAATYGGAGVAALSGGRFIASWFAGAEHGAASLKARIFSAAGVPGPVLTVGGTRIDALALSVPRIAATPGGEIMIVTDSFVGNRSSLQAWLLTPAGVLEASAPDLITNPQKLHTEGVLRLPSGIFVASYTQSGAPTATRAMGQVFRVFNCPRCQ